MFLDHSTGFNERSPFHEEADIVSVVAGNAFNIPDTEHLLQATLSIVKTRRTFCSSFDFNKNQSVSHS